VSGLPPGAGDGGFSGYADGYDAALNRGLRLTGETKAFFARGRLQFLRACLDRLGTAAGAVLEFGCGDGSATPLHFETLGADSVVGVDVTPAFVRSAEAAHGSAQARFLTVEAGGGIEGMDTAFCNGVFHHIAPADRPAAVAWVRRTLKPGGLFSFWDNNPWNPGTRWVMSRIPFDRTAIRLSAAQARRLLAEAGFEILRTDFLFVFPRPLGWLRGAERWLSRWPLGAQYQVLGRKPLPR
jgi:SAM-dependent methyltransferase